MVNIELHIEELVLHGFDAKDRHRIGTAVQDELARLFAEQGAALPFADGIHRDRVDGGSFKVQEGERVNSIGARVAQAAFQGIAGSKRSDVGSQDKN